VPVKAFRWQDGERLVRFGRGTVAEAPELLPDSYELLATPRSAAAAPEVVERAAAVHHVAPGRVDELAAELREAVDGPELVALGGGRVVDVAKALAALDPARRAAAIPTTLSAAEMTPLHRQARGAPPGTRLVRPALVLNDPALSASQPEPELAASAANSLGHAVEAQLTPFANPVATLAAQRAARLLAEGLPGGEPDRDALALGALLAGYAIGSAFYGLHHVLSQTAVREAGVGHGQANACLLPHSTRALAQRFPERFAEIDLALGDDVASVAARFAERAGAMRLRDLGVPAEALAACADAASARAELHLTPPPADRAELLALYEEAW
jgi:alcohol dehydrogenase class IV